MAVDGKKKESLVRRFLRAGSIDPALAGDDLAAAASELVRAETQRSGAEALALARRFVKQAPKISSDAEMPAYRALGWALLVTGQYAAAEKSYLAARKRLTRQPQERARVDRVLIDVYMYLGKFERAKQCADRAMRTFRRIKDAAELAKTKVNYANLLHRQDRHVEANRLYRDAASYFKKQGNEPATALCYFNQGNTLVQLFRFGEADRLYTEARDIFTKFNHQLHANGCLNGLAWLHMLQGDYNRALQELAECEAAFKKAEQPREQILCQLDRAEAYLGLNLFVDARNAARAAERNAKKLGIRYEQAKGAFFFAKASHAMGRAAEAKKALQRAESGFRRERNEAFLAATRLFAAQMSHRSAVGYRQITQARSGFGRAQLPLWEAICDLHILSDWPEKTEVFDRLKQNSAVKTVPHLYARRYTLMGDREARAGRTGRAVRYWSKAADVLDAVRAKLPPLDLRSGFFRGQSDPYRKLVATEFDRHPEQAAAWSERYKTAGPWAPVERALQDDPARQRAQESLSALADQVTALVSRIERSGTRSATMARPPEQLQAMQRQVRQDLAALEPGSAGSVLSTEAITERFESLSRQQQIVQFHASEEELFVFVHTGSGVHTYRYPEGVRRLEDFVAQWRFMVERQAYANNGDAVSSLADEQKFLARFGTWLLPPLELKRSSRPVVIIPDGALLNIPWSALTVEGTCLAERHRLLFTPSLRHFEQARRPATRARGVEVFVGAGDDLPEASQEYLSFTQTRNPHVTIHTQSVRASWPEQGQARLWHYVGHAHLRRDNPFYSSLLLHDGPLFAADFRLRQVRVNLVTLAACRTAQQTMLPGEESTGLVRSLLEMGARSVVASHWAVADRATADWMATFYDKYFAGQAVAEAAQAASLATRDRYRSAYHWAAFSVFGAG